MKTEEREGSRLLFSLLSVGGNVNAMAGALAAIISREMAWRMETIHAKTIKQTKKSLGSSDTI